MDSQTFSKAYLQGIPEKRKQNRIDQIIRNFIRDLEYAASQGKTSYMYNPNNPHRPIELSNRVEPEITNNDLISAFKRKFPDCIVTYEENWVDVDYQNKVLKRGILIDWS